jgi:D-alanine-D-alanine ligase
MGRHYEPRSWEWIDQKHLVCRERSLGENRDRLISREVVIDVERGVIADQIYAERLYSEARLRALLSGAGFVNVHVHRPQAPDSHRNQDLGMVSHRLFATCEAPPRARLMPRRGREHDQAGRGEVHPAR